MPDEYIEVGKLKGEVRKKKAKMFLKKVGRGIKTTGRGLAKTGRSIKKGYKKTEKFRGQVTKELLPRIAGAGREISSYAERYDKERFGLRKPKKKKSGFGYIIGSPGITTTLKDIPLLGKAPKKKKGKGSFDIF